MSRAVKRAAFCDRCDHWFSLWDEIEEKFGSEDVRRRVEERREADRVKLDACWCSRCRRGLLALIRSLGRFRKATGLI